MEVLVAVFYLLGFFGLVAQCALFIKIKFDKEMDSAIYAFWCFIGLFSSQWFLFTLLWLLILIPDKYYKIESFLSILLIILIIVNKFHLHITI